MSESPIPDKADDQRPTHVTNASGGVNVDAEQVNIGGDVVGRDLIKTINQTINNFFTGTSEEVRDRRNKLILLDKVRKFWIEGVLEQSVHNAAMIELGKETRPEVVERPWDMVLETPDKESRALPKDQKISEIFEQMDHALLILGGLGSGKTVTLLELARETIPLVEKDPNRPIPVIFSLSSWTERRLALHDWLVEELNAKYQIPRKIGKVWVAQDTLMLLLDGLDEVTAEQRKECVAAINRFRDDHGLTDMAVCSRVGDYEALATQLKLRGAIMIQPLSPEQIQHYLQSADLPLAALREEMQRDTELQTLAQSPLMLSMMSLAFQDASTKAFASQKFQNPEERRKQLFSVYVQRMLGRHGKDTHYGDRQVVQWLCWLAFQMTRRGQTIFLLEQLQPDWLDSHLQRWIYLLSSRLMTGLLLGICLSFSLRYGFSEPPPSTFIATSAIMVTLATGISLGIMDGLRFKWRKQRPSLDRISFWRLTINLMADGVLIVLSSFGALELANRLTEAGVSNVGIGAIVVSIPFGLVIGFRSVRRSVSNDVQFTETMRLSWKTFTMGALGGSIVALIIVLVVTLLSEGVTVSSEGYVISGAFGGFIGGVIAGLRGNTIQVRSYPGQGLRLSIRNIIIVGLGGMLITGAIVALLGDGTLLPLSLILGVLLAIWLGVPDVIQHFTIRVLLRAKNHMPWRYISFLEQATDLILLNRVGGGYIFIHRYLMEYFASLEHES